MKCRLILVLGLLAVLYKPRSKAPSSLELIDLGTYALRLSAHAEAETTSVTAEGQPIGPWSTALPHESWESSETKVH